MSEEAAMTGQAQRLRRTWPLVRNLLLALLALEISSRFVVGSVVLRLWSLHAFLPGPCRPGVESMMWTMMGGERNTPVGPRRAATFLRDHWINVTMRNGHCSVYVSRIEHTMLPIAVMLDGTLRGEFAPGSGELIRSTWQ